MRIVTLLLMVSCLAATVLFAKEDAKSGGTLSASGTGMSIVRLVNGSIEISGKGKLWVSENAAVSITGNEGKKSKQVSPIAEKARRFGRGKQKDAKPREGYLYAGFDGKAVITGEDVVVMLDSDDAQTLSATGNGNALLLGKGTYVVTTDGAKTSDGKWSAKPSLRNRTRPTPVQFGAGK